MSQHVETNKLKKQALEFYRQVPIKKYAAAAVGRDEDTFRRWEKEDGNFEQLVTRAKAEYLMQQMKIIDDPKWIISKLFREDFGDKLDVIAKDQPITMGVTYVRPSD